MRRLLIGVLALALVAAAPPPPLEHVVEHVDEALEKLLAGEETIHLAARESVIRGGQGERIVLDSERVDHKLEGAHCEVELVFDNSPDSTHQGNDAVVASGREEFVVPDVESGGDVTAYGELELAGETVELAVVLGEDEVLSGHLSAELTCRSFLLDELVDHG